MVLRHQNNPNHPRFTTYLVAKKLGCKYLKPFFLQKQSYVSYAKVPGRDHVAKSQSDNLYTVFPITYIILL